MAILPTGSQDLETKDIKPFLIQIRGAGIIANASVNDEGTSWSHGLKSVQKQFVDGLMSTFFFPPKRSTNAVWANLAILIFKV